MSGAGFTTRARIAPGATVGSGALGRYRRLAPAVGEPHQVRTDLVGGSAAMAASTRGRPILVLGHVTDLQLTDVQSPTRFEYLNRGFGDPRYRKIIPVQRPQEALTAHAVDATVRTLNALEGGPTSGAPIDFVVTTGDAIDNAQWNELEAFLALFDGGPVRLDSGTPGYEGVQSRDWPDDIFWIPDGDTPFGPDWFRRNYGYPVHSGLIEAALREFSASGLQVPWLACFGNHEALNQGVGAITPALIEAMTGGRKPVRLPDDFDHDRAYEIFVDHPEEMFAAQTRLVTPDPGRRAVSRREFVTAHFRSGARPDGHGFTTSNRSEGTAYYVHDTPSVRLIALDTTCLAGGADGCIDEVQARWLEQSLTEVHSRYVDAAGREVTTGNDDRLVLLFSHHGLETLVNDRSHEGPELVPLLGVDSVLPLLHRFPNVVLWLNGHTHTNGIRVRHDPSVPGRGFWEVTTCAVVDWPCQTRVVELIDNLNGTLSIVCTMLDHDSPLGADSAMSSSDLAALHRELAGNVPWAGFDASLAGGPLDRNVELRVSAPFDLSRLQ